MKSNIEIVKDYVAGVRPFTQVGYTGKKYKKRKIGDHWTDSDGQEWEQKKCGPVTVNRVADIVRSAREQVCKCGQQIKWGSRSDKLFFNKTGLCENCLITYETNLRILGIYDYYERYKIFSNELGFFKDLKGKLDDTIRFLSDGSGDIEMLCNSEGFIERWKDANREKILEDAHKDLKLVMERIELLTKYKEEAKNKYVEEASKYKIEIYA